MDTVINEYQKWKQHGESLRLQARQAMETRYRDLLNEAVDIAREYQADFGTSLKPPPVVTAFRFKPAVGKPKKAASKAGGTKDAGAKAVATKEAEPNAAPPAKKNPKLASLEKSLAQAKAKLDATKAAGKSTRNLDDRIYEIEDEIRLATQQG